MSGDLKMKPSKTVSCRSCGNVYYLAADESFKGHEKDCGCPGARIIKINNRLQDLKDCRKKMLKTSTKRNP